MIVVEVPSTVLAADTRWQWYKQVYPWLLGLIVTAMVVLGGYGVQKEMQEVWATQAVMPVVSTPVPTVVVPSGVVATVTPVASSSVLPSPTGYYAPQTYTDARNHYSVALPEDWTFYAGPTSDTVFFGGVGLYDNYPIMVEVVHGRRDLNIDSGKYLQGGGNITRTSFIQVGGQQAEEMIFSGSEAAAVIQTTYLGNVYTITLKYQYAFDQLTSILNRWRFN